MDFAVGFLVQIHCLIVGKDFVLDCMDFVVEFLVRIRCLVVGIVGQIDFVLDSMGFVVDSMGCGDDVGEDIQRLVDFQIGYFVLGQNMDCDVAVGQKC